MKKEVVNGVEKDKKASRNRFLAEKVVHMGGNIARFGTEYGGFSVDTTNLKEESVVYSFGIGEDLSFSEEISSKIGCNIYAFDPTPRAIEYVRKHNISKQNNFHFYPIGVSGKDGNSVFYLPNNEEYVSGSEKKYDGVGENGRNIEVVMKRVKTIMQELHHQKVDLIKMDIEGSEFDVIQDMCFSGVEFQQLCVEVHDRFWSDGYEKLINMVNILNEKGYEIVNVSAHGDELTFVRNREKI